MKEIIVLPLVGVAAFVLIQVSSHYIAVESKDRNPTMKPPESIEHFTFGYRDSIADSLWIRTIQDFEYCGAQAAAKTNGETKTWDVDPTLQKAMVGAQCEKGWTFHMLNEITDLSPKFEIIYTMGAPGLSIIVDDREGAEILFDKGIRALPKNWQIPYMAAYHALFETRKYEKAGDLLKLVGDLGGPEWVYFLATRVYSRAGRAELGKAVIERYIKNFAEDEVPERAKRRLDEINAVLEDERGKDPGSSSP
ncbi:MAG: hypothetical protein KDD68_10445 [Bdellovibrionales bacterium]|nr:hypothetical protein [Bdellovibrionales bacterium]